MGLLTQRLERPATDRPHAGQGWDESPRWGRRPGDSLSQGCGRGQQGPPCSGQDSKGLAARERHLPGLTKDSLGFQDDRSRDTEGLHQSRPYAAGHPARVSRASNVPRTLPSRPKETGRRSLVFEGKAQEACPVSAPRGTATTRKGSLPLPDGVKGADWDKKALSQPAPRRGNAPPTVTVP